MKKIACILLLYAVLFCGCTQFFDEGYHISRSHYANRPESTQEQPAVGNWISNRYNLRSAVVNMISLGVEKDTLMTQGYSGDLDEDIDNVVKEMLDIYPLGKYAVSTITPKTDTILSQTQITISITYSRTEEERRGIVQVFDVADFEYRLRSMMTQFSQIGVFSFSNGNCTDNEATLEQRIKKCWTRNPEYAVGLKEVQSVFYPKDVMNPIVEVAIQYLEPPEELEAKKKQLINAAKAACEAFTGDTDTAKLEYIYAYLWNNVLFDQSATKNAIENNDDQPKSSSYTAYGALVSGEASQSGYALAAQLMCNELGISSSVVTGMRDKAPYYWLYVSCDDEMMHFDPTSVRYDMMVGDAPPPTEPDETTVSEETPEDNPLQSHVFLFNLEEGQGRFSWNSNLYSIG